MSLFHHDPKTQDIGFEFERSAEVLRRELRTHPERYREATCARQIIESRIAILEADARTMPRLKEEAENGN